MSVAFVQGGHLVARALKAEGIDHLFTLCGGHIQMIYDGCLSEGVRVVDTRHEQSAGHAADGWARVTGKPGVAAVTAGPGVTDVVTAVANAQRAQVPMVVIGGQGARTLSQFGGQDRGSLQDMNHVELMRPVSKWAVSVPETRRLQEYMQTAFRVATTGVPGPVFLEMPLDVLFLGCDDSEVVHYAGYRSEAKPAGDPVYLDRAAIALAAAKRPMLIVGSQWRWSSQRQGLDELLQVAPMPVFVNGMARGALPPEHPCLFTRCRKDALAAADVVVVFGTPLDFRLGYGDAIPAEAKLIQVDLDGAEIGRNRTVDLGIVGDSGLVLAGLAARLKGRAPDTADWLNQVREHEARRVGKMRQEMEVASDPINPLYLCSRLNRFVGERTIVVGDGGDFVATAAYVLKVRGVGSWMDPGPLGTLGVGPGYAMAAKLAKPDHRVILVSGDGSFGLNGFEFETMARHGIKVTCVIGNDAAWTQIRRGQIEMYGEERAVATALRHTRYDLVAEGLGAHGEHVQRAQDIDAALDRAFAAPGPAVVNVEIGASEFRKGALAV
ncbi:MAG: acetolactate synthase [Deltaproteobacteria bacterium]|nr:acetolactate synthase [Deltaproteobacteria bacterium]